MSIDVAFMSLFVRKDVLEDRFPGGLASFRERFPHHAEDHYLIRLCSMEGRAFSGMLERLREDGLEPGSGIAVAEMMGGPDCGTAGIAFIANEQEDKPFPSWIATASEEMDVQGPKEQPRGDVPKKPCRGLRPKLELVRDETEPAPASCDSPEPVDRPAAPPRGERQVVILQQETPECRTTESVQLTQDGKLIIEGYDIGDAPLRAWGDDDYEYWRTIAAEDVPRVLLGLIRERFGSHREITDWLDANGIESQFSSWS